MTPELLRMNQIHYNESEFFLPELVNMELIIAELIFADQGSKN